MRIRTYHTHTRVHACKHTHICMRTHTANTPHAEAWEEHCHPRNQAPGMWTHLPCRPTPARGRCAAGAGGGGGLGQVPRLLRTHPHLQPHRGNHTCPHTHAASCSHTGATTRAHTRKASCSHTRATTRAHTCMQRLAATSWSSICAHTRMQRLAATQGQSHVHTCAQRPACNSRAQRSGSVWCGRCQGGCACVSVCMCGEGGGEGLLVQQGRNTCGSACTCMRVLAQMHKHVL